MNRLSKILISFFLLISWMGLIFYLSNMPSSESSIKCKIVVNTIIGKNNINKISNKTKIPIKRLNYIFRKCAHITVYFILSINTLMFIKALYRHNIYDKRIYIITIIFCFLYACSDEIHQLYIIGRSGRIKDVMIDTTGIIIAIIIYKFYKKYIFKQ